MNRNIRRGLLAAALCLLTLAVVASAYVITASVQIYDAAHVLLELAARSLEETP